MNKKLLTWLTVGFVGLAFLFGLIGACISWNTSAVLAMCILAMFFSLAGLIGLLLLIFGKLKKPKVSVKTEEPENQPQSEKPTETI